MAAPNATGSRFVQMGMKDCSFGVISNVSLLITKRNYQLTQDLCEIVAVSRNLLPGAVKYFNSNRHCDQRCLSCTECMQMKTGMKQTFVQNWVSFTVVDSYGNAPYTLYSKLRQIQFVVQNVRN